MPCPNFDLVISALGRAWLNIDRGRNRLEMLNRLGGLFCTGRWDKGHQKRCGQSEFRHSILLLKLPERDFSDARARWLLFTRV